MLPLLKEVNIRKLKGKIFEMPAVTAVYIVAELKRINLWENFYDAC